MTLLIVNDIEMTLDFLADGIPWAECGFEKVYTAGDAIEAKAILRENPVDITLCDIEMPGESGIDLVKWIREHQLDCDNIFLTCHADFEFAQEAVRLGCRDYVVYPTTAEKIKETVLAVSGRRSRECEERKFTKLGREWVEGQKAGLPEDTSPGALIRKITAYIMENISSPELSVNEIASHFYLSISYLSRIFKKEKGISLNHYITDLRMELAAELLRETGTPVNSISFQVGYNNYPYFTSTFKKHFGCTPSQYRENDTYGGTLK